MPESWFQLKINFKWNITVWNRYIQLLKDDEGLRVKMGLTGRSAMSSRTIEFVVKDLLEWYAQGNANRQKKKSFVLFVSAAGLTVSLPATIFIIFWYDIVVNYLLKKFISYSDKKSH